VSEDRTIIFGLLRFTNICLALKNLFKLPSSPETGKADLRYPLQNQHVNQHSFAKRAATRQRSAIGFAVVCASPGVEPLDSVLLGGEIASADPIPVNRKPLPRWGYNPDFGLCERRYAGRIV